MTDKQQDVAFLKDNFDIPTARAAKLVADNETEAAELVADRLAADRDSSPYGDAPVPVSPQEHHIPDDGGLQKEVLNRKNESGRAGP